jgi:hypothetical protein
MDRLDEILTIEPPSKTEANPVFANDPPFPLNRLDAGKKIALGETRVAKDYSSRPLSRFVRVEFPPILKRLQDP